VLQSTLAAVGFSCTAIACSIAAVFALRAGSASRQAQYFLLVMSVTVVWSGLNVWSAWAGTAALIVSLKIADALHIGVIVLFLNAVLHESIQGWLGGAAVRRSILAVVLAGILACVGAAVGVFGSGSAATSDVHQTTLIVLCLLGLLLLEQVLRNAPKAHRRGIRALSLGIGVVLCVDLLAQSLSILSTVRPESLAVLRGLFNAAAAPLLALVAFRRLNWSPGIYVSRQVVLYTTGLVGAGIYLFAMAIAATVAANSGSGLGSLPQILFLSASVAVMSILIASTSFRRRVKVFISKNFYRERYDYRKEWLRLIETLVGRSDELPVPTRTVRALAEIVGSDRGELWLRDEETGDFVGHGSWGGEVPEEPIAKGDELAAYLEKSRWVVDTVEYKANPDLYSNAFSNDAAFLREPSIYTPIVSSNALIGIVRIQRPPGLGDLSYEDHDLLKTAGQQAAVFLVHELAQEKLFETRQFEAFSKLTAFLMHDLKNVIAQQSLVVSNARKFKQNPEFIDDAMATIEASVARMRAISDRLQGATRAERSSRFDLVDLVSEVCESCADRTPRPQILVPGEHLMVDMDRDRLGMALTHLIRNAQDATDCEGEVRVRLTASDTGACIDVIDTGCGMDSEFIRNRLFRPFDSTKGAQGMGIGAYQIRETLKSVGGSIEVDSRLNEGTMMRMHLPLRSQR
jgi:putative PEP-CTERM system histidine kinase